MRIALLGNFQPDLPPHIPAWSTETHVALSLESLGHDLIRIQEGDTPALQVPSAAREADLFMWIQTLSLAERGGTNDERLKMLDILDQFGIITVGFHLDRWWDLARQDQISTQAFFRCDYLFTADGGHDPEWKAAGINHYWSPPAVYHAECYLGTPQLRYVSDIAFVGSWRGHYHPESKHRAALVSWLRQRYRSRVAFWPKQAAIRGASLNNLYASVKVVVGDSCMLEGDRGFYWSDRTPEATGRGGFLLHPDAPGYADTHPDVVTWNAWNWDDLRLKIDHYLGDDPERERIRLAVHEHTKDNHTYRHRMQRILEIVSTSNEATA